MLVRCPCISVGDEKLERHQKVHLPAEILTTFCALLLRTIATLQSLTSSTALEAEMPHQELEPTAPPFVVTSKAGAPTPDDISGITQQIYMSKTSQESLDAAYTLTDALLNSVGFRGLAAYGILAEILKASADKKNAARREGAMFALGAVFERFPPKQRISEVVFLLQEQGLVACALDALADKLPL